MSFLEWAEEKLSYSLVFMTVCFYGPRCSKDLLYLLSPDLFRDWIGTFGRHSLLQMFDAVHSFHYHDLVVSSGRWENHPYYVVQRIPCL